MNCPSCGAPLRLEGHEEGLACDYCKSVYYAEKNDQGVRVLDDTAEECCPVCTIPLRHAIFARERIRYCTRCRGMLVEMERFGVLLQELKGQTLGTAVPQPPDARELERRICCPRCHEPMDTHYYGGPGNIVIDDCSHCFLDWLDDGEVIRIVRAPDRSYDEALGPELDASVQPW